MFAVFMFSFRNSRYASTFNESAIMYFLDLQLLLQCSPRTVCPTFHSFLLASFSKKNPFLLVMNRCNGFFSCRSTTTPDFYIATRPTRYGDSTLKEKLVNSDIHTYIHTYFQSPVFESKTRLISIKV